jgi:hypothetical protein
MVDLEQRLADAWHDAPPQRPVAERLSAGHRALRRQRVLGTGAATLAVAGVLGVSTLLAGGAGGPSRAEAPVTAQEPSRQPTQEPSGEAVPGLTTVPPAGFTLERGQWAGYAPDGTLVVREGTEVLTWIADPLGAGTEQQSAALALGNGGDVRWYLLEWTPDSSSSESDVPGKAFWTLEDWVATMVEADQGPGKAATWVSFLPGTDELVAGPGVEILDQVSRPRVPDFAPPDARTAAARLRVDGERWFVLVRELPQEPAQVIPTSGRVGGPNLGTFLEHARTQFSSGEGLL